MTIGEVIKNCRWKRDWSMRQLSEESGVARQTVSDAEYGRRGTSVAVFVQMLDAMGYELVVAEKINGKQKFRLAEAVIDKNERSK